MSALSFLVLHKVKNRVREIFRRPAELIVFLFAVGFAVSSVFILFLADQLYQQLTAYRQCLIKNTVDLIVLRLYQNSIKSLSYIAFYFGNYFAHANIKCT